MTRYGRVPLKLASPQGNHLAHMPKGNLVHIKLETEVSLNISRMVEIRNVVV